MVPLQGPPIWLWGLTKLSVLRTAVTTFRLSGLPVKTLPFPLSPRLMSVDRQGLLEVQSHHYSPRAAISENPLWVRGFACVTSQLTIMTPRERTGMHPSHQARKWAAGGWAWGVAGPM